MYELSDGDIGIAYLSYSHAILVIGFLLMSWLWPSTAFEMEPVSRKEDSTDATAGEEKSAAVGEVVPISGKATPHEEYREKLRHLGIVEQFKAAREIEQCKYSELSFGQQMLTVEFVLNVVFMSVNILGLQFYIGTASEQLLVLGDVGACLPCVVLCATCSPQHCRFHVHCSGEPHHTARGAGHPVVWVDAQSIVCDQLLLHQLAWNDDERVRNDRCSPIASGNVLLVGRIPHMVVLCGVCIRGFLVRSLRGLAAPKHVSC